jgi:hypothetical protein
MSDVGKREGPGKECFLPERKYFGLMSVAILEALAADAVELPAGAPEPLAGFLVYDEDLDRGTGIAMAAGLSGGAAEKLSVAVRELGAESAAESLEAMRVAYDSCARELHVHGHSRISEDLLVELILQLADPIRELETILAAFVTLKFIAELLAHVGLQIEAWTGPLFIRLVHPGSRMGARKALRALIKDNKANGFHDEGKRSIELEPRPWIDAKDSKPEPQPVLGREWWG